MSNIQLYSNEDFRVRTTQDADGTVWFVGKDIAQALDYSETTVNNAINALMQSVPEIWKGKKPIMTPGGEQEMLCLTEQGVYFFLGRSDKPKALPYQMWIAGEVVPSIRKTGSYSVKAEGADLEIRYKELEAKNRELDLRGAELLQHMIDSPSYPITDESKAILAHEATRLITGHENRAMLPLVKEAMYSASEIGARFNVSKNKIGKVANAHGLKPPIGETNEYGTWIRTKSKYSAHECPQFMYNDNALDWFREHQELLA